ncbi:MAG TPA: sulfur carrier protein ThiS [Bryobacteraceae bacterium]|jgi:thiamine biosynthesis protein ThiS|nr:sulfur carrier protein ThiS [Bryobacteraceae bacterium]
MSREQTTIAIVVNGEPREVSPELTVLGLLHSLGLDPGRVAVELDRRIVRQAEWPHTPLHTGSNLEIVQFVGGG